ncbi:hypothetical protein, partial [Streptomyces sp. NPDC050535]|uniref:hypothetical protein n=1 Tax=Streptomyces sp. NPDC050535 TaxID=3365626 RepID=UPI0037A9C7F3
MRPKTSRVRRSASAVRLAARSTAVRNPLRRRAKRFGTCAACPPGQTVLVAGVRASTQAPPIPSGKRVIFVTLEDGTGLVDLAFFEDSHEACAHTV